MSCNLFDLKPFVISKFVRFSIQIFNSKFEKTTFQVFFIKILLQIIENKNVTSRKINTIEYSHLDSRFAIPESTLTTAFEILNFEKLQT